MYSVVVKLLPCRNVQLCSFFQIDLNQFLALSKLYIGIRIV